jgi:hypothetical protein
MVVVAAIVHNETERNRKGCGMCLRDCRQPPLLEDEELKPRELPGFLMGLIGAKQGAKRVGSKENDDVYDDCC